MSNFLTKILGDKKEWKAMEARANALPRDYRVVYGEMKSYLWRFTAGDGMDIVAVLKEVLGLFETSAAPGQGRPGRHRRGRRRVLPGTPARYHLLPGQVAGVAQPRRCREARRIAPC